LGAGGAAVCERIVVASRNAVAEIIAKSWIADGEEDALAIFSFLLSTFYSPVRGWERKERVESRE